MFLSNVLMIGLFCSNNRMVISSETKNSYPSKHVRDHVFMLPIWKGDVHIGSQNWSHVCLQILLLLHERSIVHFCRWKGWGTGCRGSQNCSSFVAIINVWSLNGFKLQPIQSLEAIVSSSTLRYQPDTFWLHRYLTTHSPFPTHSSPHSTDDQPKAPVTFSWHLIFYVKKCFGLLNLASLLASNKTALNKEV